MSNRERDDNEAHQPAGPHSPPRSPIEPPESPTGTRRSDGSPQPPPPDTLAGLEALGTEIETAEVTRHGRARHAAPSGRRRWKRWAVVGFGRCDLAGRGRRRLSLLPGPRLAAGHRARPPPGLSFRKGSRYGEHPDGGIHVSLRAGSSESRLRHLFTGSNRSEQRRHHDPPRGSCPPPFGIALHPSRPLCSQCAELRSQQNRRRTRPGAQPSRCIGRRGLWHPDPTRGFAQLRPVRQYRQRPRRHQHVLSRFCVRLVPDGRWRERQPTRELWAQPESRRLRAPQRHAGARGRAGTPLALRDLQIKSQRPLFLARRGSERPGAHSSGP